MKLRRPAALAAAVLAIAALSSACSDDEADTAKACDAVSQMETSLQDVGTALRGGTVDDLQSARDDVEQAKEDLDDAASDVVENRVDALEEAWDDLDDAIDNLDPDTPLTDVRAELTPQLEGVVQARGDLDSELDCP